MFAAAPALASAGSLRRERGRALRTHDRLLRSELDELEILKLIRCNQWTPRELPVGVAPTLYDVWESAQVAIRVEYEERLICERCH